MRNQAGTETSRVVAKASVQDLTKVDRNGPAKSLLRINTAVAVAAADSLFSGGINNKKSATAKESSSYSSSSPYVLSPPSSAFVSAVQSPYISPRALTPTVVKAPSSESKRDKELINPSPSVSYSYSPSEDVPSSSNYTPPPETELSDFSDYFDGNNNNKHFKSADKAVTTPPRSSFSFPRISIANKSSVSVSSAPGVNAKLRSCDVYIGYHGGQNDINLLRYCKWLKTELELQGIACFVADRARYADAQSHEIADRIICSVAYGVVVISSTAGLFNSFTMEEVRFFGQKKNLIPMFFEMDPPVQSAAGLTGGYSKEHNEALEGLMRSHEEFKLEAKDSDWRSCIARAASILQPKLGRKSRSIIADNNKVLALARITEELPFPRNKGFVGRHKEMSEIEAALFGTGSSNSEPYSFLEQNLQPHQLLSSFANGSTSGQSDGFADEETDMDNSRGEGSRYISLEVDKAGTKGLAFEESAFAGRISFSKRSKHKKSRSSKVDKGLTRTNSIICISGAPGVGKTELALEFAQRYSHRYKMVLWVGGEAPYLRQNILSLSTRLGLDVSADPEKERGRIRGFDEQEHEAFKRLKRELFRDVPYLIIIDHLDSENGWWEGRDLNDLIPRNTGGSHVIITTRLPKVMNLDVLLLQPLPWPDAMMLLKGKRKIEYPAEEYECLKKIEERLRRSTFGLSVIGSLLSQLQMSPSALFEILQQASFEDDAVSFTGMNDEQSCTNNPFLVKVLDFCFELLEKATRRVTCVASRMLLVGAWFAPSPVSVNLLANAAKKMPATNKLRKWTKNLSPAFCCYSGCSLAAQAWKSEEESALFLVSLGMARKTTYQPGLWIQFHPIIQSFARTRQRSTATKATVLGIRKTGNLYVHMDHLWACAFLIFGFKSELPLVHLKPSDLVLFIKKTALPLAIGAFTTFSRCESALELLKVCTDVLEEVEKSFVSQIQDWCQGSFCWKKKLQQANDKVDEYLWQEVTLLKATLLETRAKLLLRGGCFDSAEELCRTCISIRTVILGHNHTLTLAAQETLAKLVRLRSKI